MTVAVGGNSVIVGGVRPAPNPQFAGQTQMAAFLFERNSSGGWTFTRKLAEFRSRFQANVGFGVAMNSVLAAIISGDIRVFERTTTGWVSVPATGTAQNSHDIEVHSGMILSSHVANSCADARLFLKQDGTWAPRRNFISTHPPLPPGQPCNIFFGISDVDIASNRVIIGSNDSVAVQIWQRFSNGSWPSSPTAIIPLPLYQDAPVFPGRWVSIEGDDAITNSGSRLHGPIVLRRSGSWELVGNLNRPDRAMIRGATGVELLNGIAAIGFPDSIGVFQRTANGDFDYVAKLVASDGDVLNEITFFGESHPEISGRRIVTSGHDASGVRVAYVFDLPADFTQPALIEDDFEDRNTAGWTPIPGSVVSVPSNGFSSFYRQSSVAGDAGSLRTDADMENQAIEAEVVARSYAPGTGERWFGLNVRQTDTDDYYYLTMRNNNVISLRKLANGVITELASASMPVLLNRRYKLRLEAIGTRIRGLVDGQLRVEARDSSHASGIPGLRMFRTATDYDNVVVSPNPQTTLLSDDFEQSRLHPQWWSPRLGIWTEVAQAGNVVFQQSFVGGDGRITTDIDADDQVVQARARATQFTPGDRWFGLIARLQDDQNFYFLTVRSSNTVSLRKLVNGTVMVLDTATFPVSVGTWYTLRLEAVGNSLRGYVNDRPLVEATDNNFVEGTWGLATSQTAAEFDNVRVTQP